MMERKLAQTKIHDALIVRLDFHMTSRTAQYEIWVGRLNEDNRYSWKIEGKAQTVGKAKQDYATKVAELQAA